ncbi:MAG TPA: PEGA domain-containing protein [Polyangia bacterium]|jgi:hypothetical protein|nr:PEGA domain-containing protein [Polyangia bacterium]
MGHAAMWVVMALLGGAGVAHGASTKDKQRATALLREGAALLEHEDYAEALGKFTEAYGLVPSPKIQFDIGLAAEGLARPAEASRAYQAYVDGATGDTAARRAEAQGRITALRSRVTLLHITSDLSGASVTVDGVDEGTTPLPRPLVVSPGAHQIVLAAPGATTWTRAVRGDAGATIELQARLQPPPAAAESEAPRAAEERPNLQAPDDAATHGHAPAPLSEPAAPDDGAKPVYERGWFWATVGGVAAAGAVAAFLLIPRDTKYVCQVSPCIGGN